MKKTFRIAGLDCAACAQKLEEAISNLPGVNSASVIYIQGKLKVDFDEV